MFDKRIHNIPTKTPYSLWRVKIAEWLANRSMQSVSNGDIKIVTIALITANTAITTTNLLSINASLIIKV